MKLIWYVAIFSSRHCSKTGLNDAVYSTIWAKTLIFSSDIWVCLLLQNTWPRSRLSDAFSNRSVMAQRPGPPSDSKGPQAYVDSPLEATPMSRHAEDTDGLHSHLQEQEDRLSTDEPRTRDLLTGDPYHMVSPRPNVNTPSNSTLVNTNKKLKIQTFLAVVRLSSIWCCCAHFLWIRAWWLHKAVLQRRCTWIDCPSKTIKDQDPKI